MTHDESGLDEFHPDTTMNPSTERTPEFSRRFDVQTFKDEPLSFEDFKFKENWYSDLFARNAYDEYIDRFQPYRWRAVGNNGEVIAHGESYFNERDRDDNIALNYGDDTTVYTMPMYGEDRSEKLLRYGATDRNATGRLGVVDNGGTESGAGEASE